MLELKEQGLTYSAIGQRFGVNPETVRKRLRDLKHDGNKSRIH
jgi:transposase-like protein